MAKYETTQTILVKGKPVKDIGSLPKHIIEELLNKKIIKDVTERKSDTKPTGK